MSVPYWVKDAVFYQIFPDRFRNGDLNNDPPNIQPWGSNPTLWGFQGGDLRGVIEKIDYLLVKNSLSDLKKSHLKAIWDLCLPRRSLLRGSSFKICD